MSIAVGNNPVVIEELPYDPELDRLFEQAHRNLMWFNEHVREFGVFKLYRGRFVAAAGGELFVADSREEVERLAARSILTKCRTFAISHAKSSIASKVGCFSFSALPRQIERGLLISRFEGGDLLRRK